MKLKVKLTFPAELVGEPVIYRMGRNFDVVTNIRRADVTRDRGWVVLEIEGEPERVEAAVNWVSSLGIRVDPVEGDVLEG